MKSRKNQNPLKLLTILATTATLVMPSASLAVQLNENSDLASSTKQDSLNQLVDMGVQGQQSTFKLKGMKEGSVDLTLLTGDKLTVNTTKDGKSSIITNHGDGDSSSTFYSETTPDGDVFVYPEEALNAVGSGFLDKNLFNITALINMGYDDAHTNQLPIIVDYDDVGIKKSGLSSFGLKDAKLKRTLSSISADAVEVDKSNTDDFFDSLSEIKHKKSLSKDSSTIKKVWLDAQATTLLEDSVPKIGATEAWTSGYDGKGVKVAVLDTGIDYNHPDFTGKILDSKSFVPGETVFDGFGHGTHVASTIIGSGAASGGKRKGVAPSADLIVGKVMGNNGQGPISNIVAGMEWAAAQGADVVNMSIGTTVSASSSDPLATALNRLTAQYGTLFVVSAGNSGPGANTIKSPGIADSALTVGAVDKNDVLANFSSRGPRTVADTVDGGIKPEITAPGVGIIAARSSDGKVGTPVNEYYTSMNGTSMAAPHVVGAAAILVQKHPDWTPEQLKNALVSTSKNLEKYTAYEQGAGRVNIKAALDASIIASSKAEFGAVEDSDNLPSITKSVTYTNNSTQDVTLSLNLNMDRSKIPVNGMFSLSTNTLTVPAGNKAEVQITLDPNKGDLGTYSGYLTAKSDNGTLVTPVGFVKEPQKYDLTVNLLDRFGKIPASAIVHVLGTDSNNTVFKSAPLSSKDKFVTRVPKGHYSVSVYLRTTDPLNGAMSNIDYYANPEYDFDGTKEITVDAREAKDLNPQVLDEERPLENNWYTLSLSRTMDDGRKSEINSYGLNGNTGAKFGVIPSETKVKNGKLYFIDTINKRDPLHKVEIISPNHQELEIFSPKRGYRFDGTKHLSAISVGAGKNEDYTDLDVKGKLAVISTLVYDVDTLIETAYSHGAAAVMVTRTQPGTTLLNSNTTKIPVVAASYESGQQLLNLLKENQVTVKLTGQKESRFNYTIPAYFEGELPVDTSFKTMKNDYAKLNNKIYSDSAEKYIQALTISWHPWQTTTLLTGHNIYLPKERIDYVLADEMTYRQELYADGADPTIHMTEPVKTYEAGKSYNREWFKGPMHPVVDQTIKCAFCRVDNTLKFAPSPFGDSDLSHYAKISATINGNAVYYRNGVKVLDEKELLVSEAAEYRVDYEVNRNVLPGSTHGTKSQTSWTFLSEASKGTTIDGCKETFDVSQCQALPVILTSYDIPLDDFNRAESDKKMKFSIITSRQEGYDRNQTVSGVKASVSYDDGLTWVDAEKIKIKKNGKHDIQIHHPKLNKTNGFVSLRVEVWDQDGNKTEQTISRAYALK